MKVKELLEYQSFVTKRAIPSDMAEDLNQHYSVSKDEWINHIDMMIVMMIKIMMNMIIISNKW